MSAGETTSSPTSTTATTFQFSVAGGTTSSASGDVGGSSASPAFTFGKPALDPLHHCQFNDGSAGKPFVFSAAPGPRIDARAPLVVGGTVGSLCEATIEGLFSKWPRPVGGALPNTVASTTSSFGLANDDEWRTSFNSPREVEEKELSWNRYSHIANVGKGTSGSVLKVVDKESEEILALKVIRNRFHHRSGICTSALVELKALQRLKGCPNILKLHGAFFKGYEMVLVCEYMPTDLSTLLSRKHLHLHPGEMKHIIHQLLLGIQQCHDHGIMHLDVKAPNILIGSHGEVKLCDFGLSTFQCGLKPIRTSRVITLWYRPPELLMEVKTCGSEVDMWSIGCVCLEILGKRNAFPGKNEQDQLLRILRACGKPAVREGEAWPGIPWSMMKNPAMKPPWIGDDTIKKAWLPETLKKLELVHRGVRDFLRKLLAYNPYERADAASALGHEYITCNHPPSCGSNGMRRFPDMHQRGKKMRQGEGDGNEASSLFQAPRPHGKSTDKPRGKSTDRPRGKSTDPPRTPPK